MIQTAAVDSQYVVQNIESSFGFSQLNSFSSPPRLHPGLLSCNVADCQRTRMCPSVEHSSYTSIRRTRDSQEMLLWREKEEVEITTRETKLTPQMTASSKRDTSNMYVGIVGFI